MHPNNNRGGTLQTPLGGQYIAPNALLLEANLVSREAFQFQNGAVTNIEHLHNLRIATLLHFSRTTVPAPSRGAQRIRCAALEGNVLIRLQKFIQKLAKSLK